jgi:putative transposase
VPRSTYYYQPQPESAENLRLMRRLDELYMKRPFFGSRKMAVELAINRKRAQRLMRILGIEALYPKPNLSRPAPGHEVYPYLLRGVAIETSLRHRETLKRETLVRKRDKSAGSESED